MIDWLLMGTWKLPMLRIAVPLCAAGLALGLWLAPVVPGYLALAALAGLLYWASLLLLRGRRGGRLWYLWIQIPVLLIIIPMLISRPLLFSTAASLKLGWLLALQFLGLALLVPLGATLALRSRQSWPALALLLAGLLALGGLGWHRAEQTRPLVPPGSGAVSVDDDAPPGAQLTSFTTDAPAEQVLAFYRAQLPQRGWRLTCAIGEAGCRSNITDGQPRPHEVYHRADDAQARGPSLEVLVVNPAARPISVHVYNQAGP